MKIGKDHHIPRTVCPWCGEQRDGASAIDSDDYPEIGSLAVCITCGGVSVYSLGFVLQRCPEAVWQAEPEPLPSQIRRARGAILRMHSK